MNKTILLTGGTSLFGSAFLKFIPKNTRIVITEHKVKNQVNNSQIEIVKMDILNNALLLNLIAKYQPDVIIHAASASNVDFCEQQKDKAWQVNVVGTENILKASKKGKVHFIYISSNAIFDGKKDIYEEKDIPNPINFYGKTKYEGELLTQRYSNNWTIIRPITSYGWAPAGSRINPVTWVIEALSSKKNLKVVDDVYLNPLYNIDLGKIAWKIIKGKSEGIYHVAGSETLNRYQWALKVAGVFNLDANLISPVPSSYFTGKIATRPQKTIYSIEKIKKEFKFYPRSVSDGLNDMKNARQSN